MKRIFEMITGYVREKQLNDPMKIIFEMITGYVREKQLNDQLIEFQYQKNQMEKREDNDNR